jgi:hypothetical protein
MFINKKRRLKISWHCPFKPWLINKTDGGMSLDKKETWPKVHLEAWPDLACGPWWTIQQARLSAGSKRAGEQDAIFPFIGAEIRKSASCLPIFHLILETIFHWEVK